MNIIEEDNEIFSMSGKGDLHMENMKELSLNEMENIHDITPGYYIYVPE